MEESNTNQSTRHPCRKDYVAGYTLAGVRVEENTDMSQARHSMLPKVESSFPISSTNLCVDSSARHHLPSQCCVHQIMNSTVPLNVFLRGVSTSPGYGLISRFLKFGYPLLQELVFWDQNRPDSRTSISGIGRERSDSEK